MPDTQGTATWGERGYAQRKKEEARAKKLRDAYTYTGCDVEVTYTPRKTGRLSMGKHYRSGIVLGVAAGVNGADNMIILQLYKPDEQGRTLFIVNVTTVNSYKLLKGSATVHQMLLELGADIKYTEE